MSLLAYVYQASYRMREALALYQQARDKIVPKLGDYHPLTLAILRNLGHMLRVYRRNAEAIPLLEQVRERELMVLGGHNPNTVGTLYELAMAYQAAGAADKAQPMFQLAIAVLEKLDLKHSYASHVLSAASVFYEQQKQFEQAQRCRLMSLEVVKRMHGVDSAEYAGELIRVGSLVLQQKNPAAAEPYLRQALAILERRPNAGEKLYAQSLLGMVVAGQGRSGEAEPLLVEAYRGMKNFAIEHKREGLLPMGREIDTLDCLVKLYDDWNKPEEAAKWRAERESRKKEFDEFKKLKRK